jgi:peroxiredoxin
MALKVGDKAPDFTLPSFTPSADLTEVSLSGLKGSNVVLTFFPQAFTGVCTAEMCELSGNDYKLLNAKVLGISVDGTFVQKAFAGANKITIPLLSDFNKEVVKKYDVLSGICHGMKGV